MDKINQGTPQPPVIERLGRDFPSLRWLGEQGNLLPLMDLFRCSDSAAIQRLKNYVNASAAADDGKRIALCPAGGFARNVVTELDLSHFDVVGFFDSYRSRGETTCQGFPLYPLEEIGHHRFDALIILSGEYCSEIYQRVRGLLKESEGEIFIPFMTDDYAHSDENRRCIDEIKRLYADKGSNLIVLFAVGRISSNQIKHSLYLRKRGIRTVLLTVENDANWSLPLSSVFPYFDHVHSTQGDFLSYFYILQNVEVDIVHLTAHMYQNHFSLLVEEVCRAPVACEFYDVLSVAYSENLLEQKKGRTFSRLQFDCEKLLCENVDGIIHKDHELVIDRLREKYTMDKPVMQFQSYVCDEFVSDRQGPPSVNGHDIRIVHVGGIHTPDHAIDGYHLTSSLLEIVRTITNQGICFDIYNMYDSGDGQFSDYERLSRENDRFGYHRPVPNPELAGVICDYDLGWIAFDFGRTILNRAFYYASMGSKFFNFIEAGLPILVSWEHAFMAELALEYGIGIPINHHQIQHLKAFLGNYDMDELKQNVRKAQKSLSMGTQIDRLIGFYHQIIEARQGNHRADGDVLKRRPTRA